MESQNHGFEPSIAGIDASFNRLLDSNARLFASYRQLLKAAREALAMINDGHPEDAWIPLEAAIAEAEKFAP